MFGTYSPATWASRIAFAIALFAAPSLDAQNATGAINGTVTDPNGAVIPAAAVTVTNKATGAVRKMTTSSEGAFWVENLLPGEYEVRVEHSGFVSQIQTVAVQVASTATAPFQLTIGSTTQTVEVTGQAATLNTSDAALGGIVNRERVENLPLNGRSFLSIAGLEPGVTVSYASTSGPGNPNNFFQVSVAGAPSNMTTISVDGARVNDRTTGGTSQNFSAETVQEFQISTFNFDLSTGTVSAGAVNIVSRTGSNDFHGSGFFFFRDHNMAAYPALRRDPSYPDPFFVRRQYGFTLGGPIMKDRFFFFGNYERNDQVGARTIAFEDPLLAGLNHVARQPQNGHLSGLRLDYRANENHSLFVRGNIDNNKGVSGGNNMESTWIASDNYAYQTALGVTSVFKPTLVSDFRFAYSYFRNRLAPPSPDQCEAVAGNPLYCFGLNGTRVNFFGGLSIGNDTNVTQDRHPRTFQVTENLSWVRGNHRIRFGGNMERSGSLGSWNRTFTGSFTTYSPQTLQTQNRAIYDALPRSLQIGSNAGPPTFAELLRLPVTGALTIGIGDPAQPPVFNRDEILHNRHLRFYIQDSWQITRSFTLNYGIGWSWENNVIYHDLDRPAYLRPLLGNNLDRIPQDKNNFDPALGFAWAPGRNPKTVYRAAFSVHHASLNIGYLKLNDRILTSPAGSGLTQSTSTGVANPKFGQPGQPATLNFATPVDFTAQDMLNVLPQVRAFLVANQRYNGTDLSIRNIEVTKTAQGAQGLDAIYDKNFRTPYTIQVNAGVQREIANRLTVSADFVMRRGVKFGAYEFMFVDLNKWNRFSGYNLNAAGVATPIRNPVIPVCAGAQAQDPRAQCSLGPIQYGMPGILSRYSALQIKVDKAFSDNIQFTGSYALAKYTSFSSISNFDNLHEGFGIAGGHRKHRFTGSAIYQLPRYRGRNLFVRGLMNDWQLATLMEMASGTPTSVTLGTFDVEGDGTFVFRLPGTGPNTFGWNHSADDIRRFVDQYNQTVPAAPNVPQSAIGRDKRDAIGTAYPYVVLPGRFAFSDSFLTHDLRITRIVRLTEKLRLNLIGEAFNLFNISNLTGFSGTLDRAVRPLAAGGAASNPATYNFGQPTGRVNPVFGSGGPRALQFAARLSF